MNKNNFKKSTSEYVEKLVRVFPYLTTYQKVLHDLFEKFLLKDSNIQIRNDMETSMLSQNNLNGSPLREFLLLVGIKDRNNPIEIIWSILHEFGHLKQDRPTKLEDVTGSEEKYLREIEAWDIGEAKLMELELLIPHLEDFKAYRLHKQESYNPINFPKNIIVN